VSPSFVSVTLGGEALAEFEPLGFDQFVRLFLMREGQRELRMPTLANNAWYAQYLFMSKETRPWVRNYTVRAVRTGGAGASRPIELDIEFAVHGGDTPAMSWIERVRPGDAVGIFTEGVSYLPPAEAGWQLFAADESALPAVLAILEQSSASLRAEVYLEVPCPADIRNVSAPGGVNMHWLPRDERGATAGQLVLDAVRKADLSTGRSYAWIAGESALATQLRKHLVSERRIPKSDITCMTYWRNGKASPG
jgi:NADPH-dependent ferric siderophore reductase